VSQYDVQLLDGTGGRAWRNDAMVGCGFGFATFVTAKNNAWHSHEAALFKRAEDIGGLA
jgi:hypothetical protein